jgi:hypothetical protein
MIAASRRFDPINASKRDHLERTAISVRNEAQSAPPPTIDQTITVTISAPTSAVFGSSFTVAAMLHLVCL